MGFVQTTNAQFEKSWNINDDEDKENWHHHEETIDSTVETKFK